LPVAEVVSEVKDMDTILESGDDDYLEYIVNLVPKGGRSCDRFASNILKEILCVKIH